MTDEEIIRQPLDGPMFDIDLKLYQPGWVIPVRQTLVFLAKLAVPAVEQHCRREGTAEGLLGSVRGRGGISLVCELFSRFVEDGPTPGQVWETMLRFLCTYHYIDVSDRGFRKTSKLANARRESTGWDVLLEDIDRALRGEHPQK